MSRQERQELGYHIQELRADLGSIRRDLQNAATAETQRAARTAWIFAESILEHDFEVHLPRAFELLGATLLPDPPSESRRAGDAAVPMAIAREAGRLLQAALAALPSEADPPSSAEDLRRTATLMWAARPIVAEALQAILDSELPDPDEPAD